MLDAACSAGGLSGGDRALAHEYLRLVAALKDFQLPRVETEAAREHIQARVMCAIATSITQVDPTYADDPTLPNVKHTERSRGRYYLWRMATVTAALLITGAIGGWRISSSAASAYPDSPLYSVKAMEERLALATAWSDERKGTVFETIADHRLSELTFEAREHDEPLARTLAQQYGATMRSLILLATTMRREHEDTSVVLAALTHELNAEGVALRDAQASGDVMLTQALAATLEAQRSAISAGNVNVTPPLLSQPQQQVPQHDSHPGKPNPTLTPHGQGTSQPSHPNNGKIGGNGNNGGSNGLKDSGSSSNGNGGNNGPSTGRRNQGNLGNSGHTSGTGTQANESAAGRASRARSEKIAMPAQSNKSKTSQPPAHNAIRWTATDATHQAHGGR